MLDKLEKFKGCSDLCEQQNDYPFKQFSKTYKTFQPVEVNILEYRKSKGSNIAPHFDDFWIWGDRILGLSLGTDSTMTFSLPKKE